MTDITAGLKLQYEYGAYRSDIWRDDFGKLELEYTDKITARCRSTNFVISNPARSRSGVYSDFQRIRLVEPISNSVVFLGRIDVREEDWEDSYGQIMKLSTRDYLHIVADRYEYSDRRLAYGAVPVYSRSLLARIIANYADDYADVNHFTANFQHSVVPFPDVGGYAGRNYEGSSITALQAIEDLAAEDPQTVGPYTGTELTGFDFFVDDGSPLDPAGRPSMWYFPRYSLPSILHLHYGASPGASVNVLPIMPDYRFSGYAVEHKNLCIVRSTQLSIDVPVAEVEDLLNQSLHSCVKETILEDPSIASVDEAWTRGVGELAKARNVPLRGTVSVQFFPTYFSGGRYYSLRAGHMVSITIPEAGITGDFLVLSISYREPSGVATLQVIEKGAAASAVYGVAKEDPLDYSTRMRKLEKSVRYVSWGLYAP
jgi:hypothetical protein